MRLLRALPWLAALGLLSIPAHAWDGPGRLVGVSVEVEGREAPLYCAPDGSGRYYFEAREGSRYTVRLVNRTGERLGVVVAVDGLNVISGERDPSASRPAGSRPGRMYVLDPWDATTVRGWRTSLDEVRRFTFVDERASYAARSGKANGKMGWVEVAVYRERRSYAWRRFWDGVGGWMGRDRETAPRGAGPRDEARGDAPSGSAGDRAAGDRRSKAAPEGLAQSEAQERLRSLGYADGEEVPRPAPRPSYPGTGWGQRSEDPVVVVDFEPEARPAECVTLRYEYAGALRALGVLPRPWPERDRLAQRERGAGGFVRPPDW